MTLPLEFGLIERHFSGADRGAGVVLGIGDDAAVLEPPPGEQLLMTVDTLVMGTHLPEDATPDDAGFRALAVSLSDLAAMGATPLWALLALTLPRADEAWVAGFAQGFRQLAARVGVALVGGNISRGPLAASVTLTGSAPRGGWLARSGGRVGDRVLISGEPGEAAGGLAAWRRGERDAHRNRLLARYLRPEPRVGLGLAARGLATAAIDVSDGLLADLGHLCRASRTGARIALERLPLSAPLCSAVGDEAGRSMALLGGDDYELLLCCAAAQAPLLAARAADLGVALTDIGELVQGDRVAVTRDGAEVAVERSGFVHFGDRP